MPKGKQKQPGEALEKELKSTLENMKDIELRSKVSEVALLKQGVVDEMKKDPDVKQKRDELNFLLADYKDDIKGADEQISYIKFLLDSRGKL